MKENVLFTSAGDNTNFFDLWCEDSRNYDIFVCYYGDDEQDKYKEYSDVYLKRKGGKMQNFHHVWTNNIGNIKDYKIFYIVDDDIIIKTEQINELFRLFKELDVWILQPSFEENVNGSCVSHGITIQRKHLKYRYTNFVEINTPFFSRYAISKCMDNYNVSLTGYGIDILFMYIMGMEHDDKYVIVDYITCINPIRAEREIDKLQPYRERFNIWRKIHDSLNLKDINHINFSEVKKLRILLLYKGYPRISHGYQISEAEEIFKRHNEIKIVSFSWDLFTISNKHLPYTFNKSPMNDIKNIINFKPHIIHSHYLDTFESCVKLSSTLKIPFTIKSHSFDILNDDFANPKRLVKQINENKYCSKIIVFPEFYEKLLSFGIKASKLLPMYPTFHVKQFLSMDPEHGKHIMSGGAFLPKKNIEGFILLSKKIKERFPNKVINYYSVMENKDYYDGIMKLNEKNNSPVNFLTVQPEDMPAEYKKHQWLIYTACPEKKNVGNPMMVAEAQSSGVGVIMYKLRETLDDYVTENGYLYSNDDEVLEIISRDFDSDKRNKAIEIAKQRYDVEEKIKDIENIWIKNIY